MRKAGMVFWIFCLFLNMIAFASEEPSVTAKQNTRTYFVEVEAEGLSPFVRYSVIAVPENKEPEDIMNVGGYVYSAQRLADATGKIQLNAGFAESAAGGKYRILFVEAQSEKIYYSDFFDYLSGSDFENAFVRVNQATADTMQKTLDDFGAWLGFDMKEYSLAADTEKEKIAKLFFENRPEDGYADAETARESFEQAVLTVLVSNRELSISVIEAYGGALAEKLKQVTDIETKNAIADVLSEKSYSSVRVLEKEFDEIIFAGKCRAAETAGVLQRYLLETYDDVLGLKLENYNSLRNPTTVFANMLNNQIDGYSSAAELFYSSVAAQLKKESTSSDSGSSAGGGGGGFGGGSPSLQTTTEAANETATNATASNENSDVSELPKYSDIADVPWAEDAILALTEKGILSGYGDGTFRPNNTITRAEFVKLLTLAFGFTDGTETLEFLDVEESDWYAPFVRIGVKNNIVKGVGNGRFGAQEHITRQDLVVMCKRALDAVGITIYAANTVAFADVDKIADYARDAVLAFYSEDIVSGDENGLFQPNQSATRAEASKIVFGLLQRRER